MKKRQENSTKWNSRKSSEKFFAFFIILVALLTSLNARGQCASPLGTEGQMMWIPASSAVMWCDGANWQDSTVTFGASCAGEPAGKISNNAGVLRFCNGAYWVSMKGPSIGNCSGITAGTIDYDSGTQKMRFCDGSDFAEVGNSGGGATCDATPHVVSTPGTSNFVIPAGCTSVVIQAYGAGGAGVAGGSQGGGGGGGGTVVERSGVLLAAGGGGGGGGADGGSGGGGGGYARAKVAVTAGETLDLWVGGAGLTGALTDGAAGGAVGGGSAAGTGGQNSTYGGGAGSDDDAVGIGGGDSTYGGGGGAGKDNVSAGGGNSVHGGGGGSSDNSPGPGTSTSGNAGLSGDGGGGGGGGGFGDIVIKGSNGASNGTAGGAAANAGPGTGGTGGGAAGNGRLIITPTACPSGGVNAGSSSACWYLGAANQSCDTVCSGVSMSYDAQTLNFAGSAGTNANCDTVLNALGVGGTATAAIAGAWGCALTSGTTRNRGTTATLASSVSATRQRACACYTVDSVPDLINWANFDDTSSVKTLSGINSPIDLEFSAAHSSGTPTYSYRMDGGAWIPFSPGSPVTINNAPSGSTFELMVDGVVGASGTITLKNLSDSNTILDTVVGTVATP